MGSGVSEPLDPRSASASASTASPRRASTCRCPTSSAATCRPSWRRSCRPGHSSGGNVSYVPIPYRKGCRISLVGAQKARLWYQFHFHRLARPGAVASFTGAEDLSALRELLAAAGKRPVARRAAGALDGGRRSPRPMARSDARWSGKGPRSSQPCACRRRAPPGPGSGSASSSTASGGPTSRSATFSPIRQGRRRRALAAHRRGLGRRLYVYFPMPFFDGARVTLQDRAPPERPAIEVSFTLPGRASRRRRTAASSGSSVAGQRKPHRPGRAPPR